MTAREARRLFLDSKLFLSDSCTPAPPRTLDPKREAEFVNNFVTAKMYVRGMKTVDLARHFGISRQAVIHRVNRGFRIITGRNLLETRKGVRTSRISGKSRVNSL